MGISPVIGPMRKLSTFLAWLSAITLLAIPAFPQAANGRIVGTVTDPAGAVIPGAKVTVTNAATGVRWETTTRQDGSYQALELPIGNYSVSVQQEGFGTAVTQPSELQINQSLRIDCPASAALRQGTDSRRAPASVLPEAERTGLASCSMARTTTR